MRKFYLYILGLILCTSTNIFAQESAGASGFYRLENPAFGDEISVEGRFGFKGVAPDAGNAGAIFSIEAGEFYTAIPELQEIQRLYDEGLITGTEFVQMMQQVNVLNGWKSGLYPIKSFVVQGVDYAELLKKIDTYADNAIETFLNEESADIYREYRNTLTMLCIFASDVINPSNLENEETFAAWAEAYLTKWHSVADFGLYLNPINAIPDDTSAAPVFTGAYNIMFKTPVWVGNMKKAQTYINNMIIDDAQSDIHFDLWESAKKHIVNEIKKDYPEDSPVFAFLKQMLESTEMDTNYLIGENEDGTLYSQPTPDTFGENGVVVTEEDFARCVWYFDKVTEDKPLVITAKESDAEGNYYSTLYTGFAYDVKSADTKVYYATAVDASTGECTLEEISGTVPALTPVIIKSTTEETSLLPVSSDAAAIEGNALLGTLYAQQNSGDMASLAVVEGSPVFKAFHDVVPANTTYVHGDVSAISQLMNATGASTIYDLQGRKVETINQKGIYIVNGKCFVR